MKAGLPPKGIKPHLCFNPALTLRRIAPRCVQIVVTHEKSPINHFVLQLLCPHGIEDTLYAYVGTPDYEWASKHWKQP